ncbi:membrane peptidoglycan carboxypeptidase [Kibdelosporangium banguiense]|uniref:Membrane peptidoglycan carboxypeptidase n=1 Tax=Kibdelosporangium banguiense TaxID=1365924 RepID=A0ABS4TR49_9PSEU|nr:transglycosylase domain-containing protein [Kibdelosporangium banguiense]MBP2326881.1 membrane peptidoglycan carboxypeptidase [Kibdelosporangium banguiense]
MVKSRARAFVQLVALCVTAGVVLAAILFPFAGGAGLAANRISDTIEAVPGDLANARLPLGSTVLDRDGNPIAYLYDQDRQIVTAEQMSPYLRKAIVAVEDHRFYQHNGVDPQRSLKAVGGFIAGESAGGGSTLTQQYVKNYLAYVLARDEAGRKQAMEHSPARKIREAKLALELESQLGKEDILTRYLNLVPFGGNIFGVKAAARTYFSTTPDKLTLSQAAFLAGLVNKPSTLLRDPVEAVKRRNIVLERMVETGFLPEGRPAAEQAKKEPLGIVQPLNTLPNDCGNTPGGTTTGFFCGYVLDYLAKLGIPKDEIKRGGYTIKTTMDPKATQAAKEAAEGEVAKDTKGIANVMAVVEPGKDRHAVRALAANRDFGVDPAKGQTAYRLPSTITRFGAGSIYKVFTAAAAMDSGVGINDQINVPKTYTSGVYKGSGNKPYTVNNASDAGDTQMTLQDALAQSPNTGFVILEEKAGLNKVVDMSVALGMRESMKSVNRGGERPDPEAKDTSLRVSQEQWIKDGKIGSFTLGVTVTSVLELANVGATLVSDGTWCPPSPIDQVLDRDGKPVDIKQPPCDQAVESALARSLAQGLSKDTISGTASKAARDARWDRQMLGKTGTTQIHQSAGFLGATPQMAGAVLTFSDGDRPRPICDGNRPFLCENGNIYGGKVPARTWFEAMKTVHQNLPPAQLPPADPRFE